MAVRIYELPPDIYFPPPGPWADAELDRRHEAAQRAFPGSLTYEQFVYLTLESARDIDEICHPPSIQLDGHGHQNSATWRMWLKGGLIEHRGGYHASMRWYITEAGRAELEKLRPKYDGIWHLAQVSGAPLPDAETRERKTDEHK